MTQDNTPEEKPTFDMYHLFSRWDFILLVVFVVLILAMTIAIIMRDQVV
jgi:hypothetical protein